MVTLTTQEKFRLLRGVKFIELGDDITIVTATVNPKAFKPQTPYEYGYILAGKKRIPLTKGVKNVLYRGNEEVIELKED